MEGCKKRNAKTFIKCLVSYFLTLLFVLQLAGCGAKNLEDHLEAQTKKTAEYVLAHTPEPNVASIGGDWAVKGIFESGIEVPDYYFDSYYDNVRARVKSSKGQLHETYYSDYARVAIGLSAIGKTITDVEGYDLTAGLEVADELFEQGVHAVAYTLVALRVANVASEQTASYVAFLEQEMEALLAKDGGKATDYLAIGLLGLACAPERNEALIEQTVEALSKAQQSDGTIGNCETTAEAIVALTQSGIDVFSDKRFWKDGHSLGESLLLFAGKDGSFSHKKQEDKPNAMATEKALLALDAMCGWKMGRTLY